MLFRWFIYNAIHCNRRVRKVFLTEISHIPPAYTTVAMYVDMGYKYEVHGDI